MAYAKRPPRRTTRKFNITGRRTKKSKYSTGTFVPKNPEKYVGKSLPTWRSSWENTVMKKFDEHKSVLKWDSEGVEIPYQDPTTLRWRRYIPDFLVLYVDKYGNKKRELVEIKPKCQTFESHAKSKRDKEAFKLNQAKWESAKKWCELNGFGFKILTEEDIYR